MLKALKQRREDEQGFTLIELMVVVLIIGILLAIAVPTFLNAQNSAKTKAATSNLRSSLSAVKTVYTDQQTYLTDTTATDHISQAELKAAQPSLDWQGGSAAVAVTSSEQISFVGTATVMGLATRSALGDCFYIIDNVGTTGGGTTYAKRVGPNTDCTAVTTAPTASSTVTVGNSPKAAGW